MARNALDLARYLALLAARLNARLRGRARLTARPFRTPAAPIAILATRDQGLTVVMWSQKGRTSVEGSYPVA